MNPPLAPDGNFVRRLRRRVRATVRANEALRADRRRAPRRRNYFWLFVGLRVIAATGVGVLGAMGPAPADAAAPLAAWALLVTLHLAGRVQTSLSDRRVLWPWFVLPTTPDDIFARQTREVVRLAAWLAADCAVFGTAWTLAAHAGPIALVTVPVFAAAQGVLGLGLAAALVVVFPRVPFGPLTWLVGWLGWMLGVFLRGHSAALAALVDRVYHGLGEFSPAGWVLGGFLRTTLALDWRGVIPLVAPGAALFLLAPLRRVLRGRFNLEKLFGRETGTTEREWVPDDPEAEIPPEPLPPVETPAPVDSAAIAAALRRELGAPPGLALFRRGVIARAATRCLSPRQRVLVDFFQPCSLFRWDRGWLIAFSLVVAARLGLALGGDNAMAGFAVAGGLALFALPLFGGLWPGFNTVATFQAQIGFNSFLPLGFWESARLVLAINALRTLAAMPLVALGVRYGFVATPLTWSDVAGWTCTVLAVALAAQPCWVILAHSKHSNDTRARWWFSALMVGWILFGLFGGIITLISQAADGHAWMPVAGALALLLYTHLGLLFYGWAYNRGVFDLVAVPRR